MNKKKFDINGMTCTACALAIERQLSKVDGVDAVNVNFATEQMQIEYDESTLDVDEIQTQVVKVGYEAIDIESKKSFIPP